MKERMVSLKKKGNEKYNFKSTEGDQCYPNDNYICFFRVYYQFYRTINAHLIITSIVINNLPFRTNINEIMVKKIN